MIFVSVSNIPSLNRLEPERADVFSSFVSRSRPSRKSQNLYEIRGKNLNITSVSETDRICGLCLLLLQMLRKLSHASEEQIGLLVDCE